LSVRSKCQKRIANISHAPQYLYGLMFGHYNNEITLIFIFMKMRFSEWCT